VVGPRRRAELQALATGARRGADGGRDELDDGLGGTQVGVEEVPLDLAGEEAAQGREVLIVGGRQRGGSGRECRALEQVVKIEVGSLGDAPPFSVQEYEGGEAIWVGSNEDPVSTGAVSTGSLSLAILQVSHGMIVRANILLDDLVWQFIERGRLDGRHV
jgi:hypothetical protein